jgi:hypothetical protein
MTYRQSFDRLGNPVYIKPTKAFNLGRVLGVAFMLAAATALYWRF